MRDWYLRTMQGRYGQNGTDRLNRFLLVLALIIFVLSAFGLMRSSLPAIVLIILSYYRLFSRNVAKRYRENMIYCTYADRVKARLGIRGQAMQGSAQGAIAKLKSRMQQARYYHIYRCPSCGQKIRIPRGKGKIEIRCPKCSAAFIKRA